MVEEVAQMDKVEPTTETKSAHDFLATGMIQNAFNIESHGKPIVGIDLDKLDGEKVEGLNKAQELLKAYKDTVEVEEAPVGEPEKTSKETEAEADKIAD